MTQDDIIQMALEAGYKTVYLADVPIGRSYQFLERFAALVAAHEREACAKVADNELMNTNMLTSYPPKSSAAWNIAAAIRERGEK